LSRLVKKWAPKPDRAGDSAQVPAQPR